MQQEIPLEKKLSSKIEQISQIKINADIIIREVQCSICLNDLENSTITKCGHTFCKICIDEVINRHHKCPQCNNQLNLSDTFLNYPLNSLISKQLFLIKVEIVKEEILRQQHQSIQNIFALNEQNVSDEMKQIENMFKKYISRIYFIYENKYQEAFSDYQQQTVQLNKEFHHKLNDILENESKNIQDSLQIEYQERMNIIKSQFDLVKQFYLEGLEKNLSKIEIDPELLDIRVSLIIPSRKVRIETLFLKPSSRIVSLSDKLHEIFLKQNNPIQNLDPALVKIVAVPMEKNQLIEQDILKIVNIDKLEGIQVCGLNSEKLFATMKLKPGSFIYILGEFSVKSDLPQECMTYVFENEMKLDYFSCETCKINWICFNCADYCHKNHQIQKYLSQHTATWACCYCVSKGFCKALNKNHRKSQILKN